MYQNVKNYHITYFFRIFAQNSFLVLSLLAEHTLQLQGLVENTENQAKHVNVGAELVNSDITVCKTAQK